MKKHQKDFEENREDSHIREFLDMIAPSVIWFETDHFICGNTYRCVWAIREYPTATDEQAILSHLGEKDGVTLHIYTRHVTAMEEKRIISNGDPFLIPLTGVLLTHLMPKRPSRCLLQYRGAGFWQPDRCDPYFSGCRSSADQCL